ncbi:TPA: hypothetical protein ACH3X2_013788 [Trebouxia sp. C0005]
MLSQALAPIPTMASSRAGCCHSVCALCVPSPLRLLNQRQSGFTSTTATSLSRQSHRQNHSFGPYCSMSRHKHSEQQAPHSQKLQRQALAGWHRLMTAAAGGAAVLSVLLSVASPAQADPFLQSNKPPLQEMKAPEADSNDLSQEEIASVKLFQQNTPSVVNISNIAVRQDRWSMDSQKVPQGMGSGFFWDDKGHIVTNFHVIKGAADIKVALIDQSVWSAKLIGGDPDKDIAVLQLECETSKIDELKPISLGQSSNLLVGQKVYAIGNPFGLDHTLTQGIVSGVGRELNTPGARGVPIRNVIQTDAAINPGNSGGVLLDSKGRLIGINTAIADPTGRGASSGVGFAIPVDSVKGLVDQILKFGRVIRPVLGITIAPPQTVRQLGLDGVLVLEAPSGSPANQAGIKGTFRDNSGKLVLGDILTGINGKAIKLQKDLFAALDDLKPGDKVQLDIVREGKQDQVSVTLGERSDPSATANGAIGPD